MIYLPPTIGEPITQGDVIDDCPVYRHVPNDSPDRQTGRVIVMTQACDIAQSKADRVVVAVVYPATQAVERGELKGPTIRDQVRRGQIFGWYFLPEAQPPVVLPESIVNLRDLHTIPRAVLEQLVAGGKRVCRLATPYREHMAQHFAVTYMRIALPDPYETRP